MIDRADALSVLASEDFDLAVVGGGITGAGVAFDAAARGLRVALIERDDWASGTSSRSTKMIHGGLRYLESLDLSLVREALVERRLMVRLAPHLVRPLPFVVPAEGPRPSRALGVGLGLYRALGMSPIRRVRNNGPAWWSPERHRTVDAEEAIRLVPALEAVSPAAATVFTDCQTDDVRLVLTVIEEAVARGAVAANRLEASGVLEEGGIARGLRCRCTLSGDELTVRARHVVNATGVWADRLPGTGPEVPALRPSRGTHVVLRAEDVALAEASCSVTAADGRRMVAIPWQGRVLVGPTDADYEGSLRPVAPDPGEVDYLLDSVNRSFDLDLDRSDAVGAFSGVRPLVGTGSDERSVDVSRREALVESPAGVITITGGKLTTWRRMAASVVERIVRREGREAPCPTARIPLGRSASPGDLQQPAGPGGSAPALPPGCATHLACRYGAGAAAVLAACAERPELCRPILEGRPEILAEVAYAARREQAHTVGDCLLRRTRLGLLAASDLRGAEGPALEVARTLGAELGWDRARIHAEAERWPEEAALEGIDPAALPEPAPAS